MTTMKRKTARALVLAAGIAAAAASRAPPDARSAPADGASPSQADTTARPLERALAAESSRVVPALRLVVAPSGNEVRYRVREQLVGVDLPNDAVGATGKVNGAIAVDADGRVLPAASRFVVDAATFTSDRDRRDGYVRGRLLDAEQYPTVVLVPTEVRGLALPLPTSGTKTFELAGDLTVRGVTRPTVWRMTARFENGRVTGTGWTAFTFADFGLQQPRVPVVLSVADSIRLEYDFNLIRAESTDS
jgi:polyisoprenoid-binding protein YceI